MEIKDIKTLIAALDQSTVAKLEFTQGEQAIKLEKETKEVVAPVYQSATPVVAEVPTQSVVSEVAVGGQVVEATEPVSSKSTTEVKAPLVGVFYVASSPEAEPFIKVGQSVNEGDTVCILEAMKVLNEIKAPKSGTVVAIHIENGDVAEFDQVLMEIGD